jgi:putative phage-type endonuclease
MSASTREQWLFERRTGIGGSDAATVMGCNPYKSLYALFAEKSGLAPEDEAESEAAEWGKRLEAAIAAKYADVTGRQVNLYGSTVPTIMRHPRRAYMLGSIDADVACADFDGAGILEIKTTGVHRADDWEEAAPLAYQVQLQHYFAVTGRRWGSFAVLIGGQKFKWYDVQRNDKFIATLEERCAWFWGLVERGEAPDIDGTESTAEALKALYPRDTGETIDLGPAAIEIVEQLEAAKAELAAAEARKRELDNRVRAAMGPASYGIVPGLGKFSLKLQRREAHTVAASEFRPLRFTKIKEKSR